MEIFIYYNNEENIYFLDPISKNFLLNNNFNFLFNNIVLDKGYKFIYGIFIPLNILLELYKKAPDAFPYCFHFWLSSYQEEDDYYE